MHNLKPIFYLESNGETKNCKNILNREAGIYLCINLYNGKLYVGSASKGYIYRRYRCHLFPSKNIGSQIVKKALLKYGISNFAFVVLETLENNKELILSKEQYYIDLLQPVYNIAKVAGSVIGVKRTIEQRLKQSLSISPEHIEILLNINKNKIVSEYTRNLLRQKIIGRKVSETTRIKISINNAKSTPIEILENNNIVHTFKSIKECAEYFYNDPMKRGPIRWSIKTGKLLFNKYKVIIKIH